MWEFASDHADLLAGLGILSAVMFFASLVVVPWLLARLPADYFIREHPQRTEDRRGWIIRLAGKLFKNTFGALLLLAGIAMLALPGQGLLTMLIGISLLDFPGKRKLELRIIRRPRLLRAINWIRNRYHQPQLIVDDNPDTVHPDNSATETPRHNANPAPATGQNEKDAQN